MTSQRCHGAKHLNVTQWKQQTRGKTAAPHAGGLLHALRGVGLGVQLEPVVCRSPSTPPLSPLASMVSFRPEHTRVEDVKGVTEVLGYAFA